MTALVANLLILGVFGLAGVFSLSDPDLYYRIVQEDEVVEWTSFWAFALAAGMHARLARTASARGAVGALFPVAVAAFCLFVALEEISWGQRLIGYRPPTYFLEHNYQQELNFHNVVPTAERKLALLAVIAGYGLLLPLLARLPASGAYLRRFGFSSSMALAPAFGTILAVYWSYPWDFTGEWVELGLGFGFLLTALDAEPEPGSPWQRVAARLGLTVVAVGVGSLTAAATRMFATGRPEVTLAARAEAAALRRDLQIEGVRTSCGTHKRLYTWVREEGVRPLRSGDFAGLTQRGLPEERAQFFLDPWNSPWWVRHTCDRDHGRRVLFVYSFGPNRRRDSDAWALGGDDVGAVVRREIRERPAVLPAHRFGHGRDTGGLSLVSGARPGTRVGTNGR